MQVGPGRAHALETGGFALKTRTIRAAQWAHFDWDDPDGREAYYLLAREEIYDKAWREIRRRASLFVTLLVPLLAGLLLASFPFLTRAKVMGRTEVMIVAALGGLLGGVLLCAGRLASLVWASARPSVDELWPSLPGLGLALLAKGLLGGACAGILLVVVLSRDSYRPQTVYLVSVAGALVLVRWLTGRSVSTDNMER